MVEEEPQVDGSETWRVLRVYLPGRIASHGPMQRFYFGSDGLLRKRDYNVEVAGNVARISMILDPDGNLIELSLRASIVGRFS